MACTNVSTGAATGQCVPWVFKAPTVFGAEVTSIAAHLVTNYTSPLSPYGTANSPPSNATGLTFCNVTVSYTHPGRGDNISVTAWLPPIDSWNERMQGVGGGGWVAGGSASPGIGPALFGAVGAGYAPVTTDAGLYNGFSQTAEPWALLSPGNVNLYYLENLATRSLYDQAIIGKSLIEDFYGKPPKKSYWSGCSQGGRQGMMLAQRYPDLYDGIAAAAPAINWNYIFLTMFYPQLIMNLAGQYPQGCELDAITAAAVSACDGLDGVIDGVISNPDECRFDPYTVVGNVFNCSTTGMNTQISRMAAAVVNATWAGPKTADGITTWYGPQVGSDLSGPAATNCTGGACVGAPLWLGSEWMRLFIQKNRDFNLTNVSHEQYDQIFYSGRQQFASIIETDDPDLSQFKASGGKIITFHGLADNIIPVGGSVHYYDAVTALDPDVKDFYRLFLAPGIYHCTGGPGGQPYTVLEDLVKWVENDTVPDTLPVDFTATTGTTFNQIICPYPAKAVFTSGSDPTLAASYTCA